MDAFELLAALTTLAALFSWVNHRFLGLPTTIGLMLLGLGFSTKYSAAIAAPALLLATGLAGLAAARPRQQ